MDDTGRIRSPLLPTVQRVLYTPAIDDERSTELRAVSEVDRAHLVMLTECRLASPAVTAPLLRAIGNLRATAFEALRAAPAPRGLYLMYEDHLIASCSARIGGILQTARSRNDLQATVLRLRLRRPIVELLSKGLRLLAILLRRARQHSRTVMPAYTHGQPAMPSTYGHYLAAVARALARELQAFVAGSEGLDECPLGAGAIAGSTLPIVTTRTAALLGFQRPIDNAIDAVASRDFTLRQLASIAALGVLLSRVAADFTRWCGPELRFLRLPDGVVGSSSAMPQKRNPFVLEHVQGRAASPLGAFVTACAAMGAAPFTHAISVGTEGVRPVFAAFADVIDTITLMRVMVTSARPDAEAMRRGVSGLGTLALELVNEIVRRYAIDFRSAHHLVGEVLTAAESPEGHFPETEVQRRLTGRGFDVDVTRLQPETVVDAAEYGGGPAPASVARSIEATRRSAVSIATALRRWRHRWAAAERQLDIACQALVDADIPVSS